MKVFQIPRVIFESTSKFSFKFCINLQCHQTYLFCTFLAETSSSLVKRSPLKYNFLRYPSAWVKIRQIVVSVLKRQVNSSSNFISFFIVMIHNSSVNLNLIHFLLWIKGSHQGPITETFESSGKNFLNSSSHFPNHKSVFLQIWHHPSVSWKITPLDFFRSNVIYFSQNETIKSTFWEWWVLRSKFSKCLSFLNRKSVFLQILHHSSVSWNIIPLYFLAETLYTFNKKSLSKHKFGKTSRE